MKVEWTLRATEHLLSIYEYIASDSPRYANKLIDRLIRRSNQLEQFPLLGRRVPEYDAENIRELLEGNYRIIYRVTVLQIDVIAVVHGTMRLPPEI